MTSGPHGVLVHRQERTGGSNPEWAVCKHEIQNPGNNSKLARQ